jgi:hypothetical protein
MAKVSLSSIKNYDEWRNGGITPRIPNLDIRSRCSRPDLFTPGERAPRYPLDRRLGGPQNRSGRRGEEKILDPTGTRTPTPRPYSQSLYRLSYVGKKEMYNVSRSASIGWDNQSFITPRDKKLCDGIWY